MNKITCILATILFTATGTSYALAAPVDSTGRPIAGAAGWTSYLTDYVADDTSCGWGRTRVDFALREYNSRQSISNATGVTAQVMVWQDGAGIVQTRSGTGSALSPSVCINANNQSVWLRVTTANNSQYYGFEPIGRGGLGLTNAAGKHLRGSVHLQRKSEQPTLLAVSPSDSFINNSDPVYTLRTRGINNLYGESRVNLFHWFSRVETDASGNNRLVRIGELSAGSFSSARDVRFRFRNLADGFYVWQTGGIGNGVATASQPATSCGVGKIPVRIRLADGGSGQLANMTGVQALLRKVNLITAQTQTLHSGTQAESPVFCLATDGSEAVALGVRVDETAMYFNTANDTVPMSTQLVNVSGENVYEVTAALPRRTGPLVSSLNVNLPPYSINVTNYNLAMPNSPETAMSNHIRFIIDTVNPDSSVSATQDSGRVTVANIVRDISSGLRNTVITITNTSDATDTFSFPYNFAVGSGLNGGPIGTRTVRASFNLTPGQTYSYRAVTRDVAGNVTQTPSRTITVSDDVTDVSPACGVWGGCNPGEYAWINTTQSGDQRTTNYTCSSGAEQVSCQYTETVPTASPSCGVWGGCNSGNYSWVSTVGDRVNYTCSLGASTVSCSYLDPDTPDPPEPPPPPDPPLCSPNQGNSCTSAANVCGMRNSGTIQCNGSCSATRPSDSLCECRNGTDDDGDGLIDFGPTPGVNDPGCTSLDDTSESNEGGSHMVSLTADPLLVRAGEDTTIEWNTGANVPGLCFLAGSNVGGTGVSSINPSSQIGSTDVTITAQTTFTLTCGTRTDSVDVFVVPDLFET